MPEHIQPNKTDFWTNLRAKLEVLFLANAHITERFALDLSIGDL